MTKDDIKNGRKRLGLTQTQAASALGVQQPEVSHWERGTRGIPLYAAEKMTALVTRQEALELYESYQGRVHANPAIVDVRDAAGMLELLATDPYVIAHAATLLAMNGVKSWRELDA